LFFLAPGKNQRITIDWLAYVQFSPIYHWCGDSSDDVGMGSLRAVLSDFFCGHRQTSIIGLLVLALTCALMALSAK
jgi:hypothetical protein